MTLSVWMSIAALLISFSALLLSRRKYSSDQRLVLAKQIADIKDEYGATLRILDQVIGQVTQITEVTKGDRQNIGIALQALRSQLQGLYDKLGYKPTVTTDPVTLSTIAVESKHMKESLADIQSELSKITALLPKEQNQAPRTSKTRG